MVERGVAYSAAKAAQLGFARALARELGPHGITVNSVAPGLIDTDITGDALEGERKAALIAGIPVGRNGRVSDVADLITYLCREESGYITGATYDVNGGSHIHCPELSRWSPVPTGGGRYSPRNSRPSHRGAVDGRHRAGAGRDNLVLPYTGLPGEGPTARSRRSLPTSRAAA